MEIVIRKDRADEKVSTDDSIIQKGGGSYILQGCGSQKNKSHNIS